MGFKDTWTSMRVRRSTLLLFRAAKTRRVAAHVRGQVVLTGPEADRLSDDAQLRRLLAFIDNHARRRKASRSGCTDGSDHPALGAAPGRGLISSKPPL